MIYANKQVHLTCINIHTENRIIIIVESGIIKLKHIANYRTSEKPINI